MTNQMRINIEKKEDAKPITLNFAHTWVLYKVVLNTNMYPSYERKEELNKLVGNLAIVIGNKHHYRVVLNLSTGLLLDSDDIKFLAFLRDFETRSVSLIYDETDKPSNLEKVQ